MICPFLFRFVVVSCQLVYCLLLKICFTSASSRCTDIHSHPLNHYWQTPNHALIIWTEHTFLFFCPDRRAKQTNNHIDRARIYISGVHTLSTSFSDIENNGWVVGESIKRPRCCFHICRFVWCFECLCYRLFRVFNNCSFPKFCCCFLYIAN